MYSSIGKILGQDFYLCQFLMRQRNSPEVSGDHAADHINDVKIIKSFKEEKKNKIHRCDENFKLAGGFLAMSSQSASFL